MITKNYKSIFSYIAALTVGLFLASCDQEDNTGYSTFSPTSPTTSLSLEVTDVILVEGDQEYEYTVNISEPQLVDIHLYAFQADGDATLGDDFTLDQILIIPAGATSTSGKIKILQDDIFEDTETAKITIGDNKTANTSTATADMNFTILNYTEGDLVIDLSWSLAAIATNDSGVEFSPTEFADMRLLVSTTPDNINIVGESDGGSFETYVLTQDMPDGDYYLVTDFYSANESIFRDINVASSFYQVGIMKDNAYSFASAINSAQICESNFFVLNKIVKSGGTYTIESVGLNNMESFAKDWSQGYDVKDYYAPEGWPSHITTGIDCTGQQTIFGLNKEWIENVWGETIEEEGTVYYTVDASGVVTIPEQYIFTTMWSGALYDYTVSGTGTLDLVTGDLHLEYHMFQDGWSVDGYWYSAGGLTTPYFEANVTTDVSS